MSDHLPIESLRPGGAPANELPPDVDPVWDSYDNDGDPKVSSIGGALIFAPELVDIRTCAKCGQELVSPQFLKLHMEREHGRADE